MLERLGSSDFTPLVGRTLRLTLPGGATLSARVDGVSEQPHARAAHAGAQTRTPFQVALSTAATDHFDGSLCTVALPDGRCLQDVWVGRQAELGRDPGRSYLHIQFN